MQKWLTRLGVIVGGAVLSFSLMGIAAADDAALLQKAWSAYNIGHYKEALNFLHPLAQDGNTTAQILIGRCYENGLGVPQNVEEAVKWYKLAAEKNDTQAQVALAYCYELGVGVPKDPKETVDLMRKAANAGNAEAQFNLALYLGKGQYGVKKDHVKSFEWAIKSARQGYAQAERLVGAYYEAGIGIKQDQALSREWYAKAKAKGLERDGSIFKTIKSVTPQK